VNQDRCESVDDGVRCQLFIHDDDQHAALIFNEIDEWTARRARIQARKADTKLGANRGQRPVPARGLLPWAGDFPRRRAIPGVPPAGQELKPGLGLDCGHRVAETHGSQDAITRI
jgi:hypothetical protein